MQELENTSRIVADDIRKAERSINLAARDTTQLLLTMFDATESHQISPAFAQPSVKATVAALAALVEGQHQMAMRAHPLTEKLGRHLGLTEKSWGVPTPKPAMANLPDPIPEAA